LIRAIGRRSLTAAIVNGVTGASIFVMPATITSLVGASSPVAVLLAGCAIFLIVLCFAEVGSRFVDAGGPYLYTREAFGPAIGFQVGWLHVWIRLFSCAAWPGETRNPRGDTAFALIAGMLTVTMVYGLVQVSVIGVLPRAADHAAPIASALGELLGRGGGALASVAALIAGSGWLLGFAQMTPRILYAMAERHELPSILGRVHPRYRTPHIAILVNSCAALGLPSTEASWRQ